MELAVSHPLARPFTITFPPLSIISSVHRSSAARKYCLSLSQIPPIMASMRQQQPVPPLDPSMPPTESRYMLLELPSELWDMIWALALTAEHGLTARLCAKGDVIFSSSKSALSETATEYSQLQYTSRQIRAETAGLVFTLNDLHFFGPNDANRYQQSESVQLHAAVLATMRAKSRDWTWKTYCSLSALQGNPWLPIPPGSSTPPDDHARKLLCKKILKLKLLPGCEGLTPYSVAIFQSTAPSIVVVCSHSTRSVPVPLLSTWNQASSSTL